jgi:penicillin amidase
LDRLRRASFGGDNAAAPHNTPKNGSDTNMLKRILAACVALILVLATAGYAVLSASLPRREGSARVPGLRAETTVELDDRAIPHVRAASFEDALRAEGYMHAEERYFQMDLLRRTAAGELAELVGEVALGADKAQRPFDFRARARALLGALPAEHVAWLTAYAEGVNAGLEDLGARPPEYWLLGAAPRAWRPEDTLLVVFSFYTILSNNDSWERAQGVMHAVLPQSLYEFLTPSTSRFDRPLLGGNSDPTGGYEPAPIPSSAAIDLRTQGGVTPGGPPRVDAPLYGPASNQWAVGARRSRRSVALLANDPHLVLRVPNVFYRAELEWPGGIARGVSIPGVPGLLIGANDSLAWGATVSNADQSDWVVIEVDPQDPTRYRTPTGTEAFVSRSATIAVAGRPEGETVSWRSTRFGPVVATDWRGRPLALHATWLQLDGLNLEMIALATARSVDEGFRVLETWAGPALNWALADTAGNVGWIVNGPLPQRSGFDGSRPESWADGRAAWIGETPSPRSAGGTDGSVFSANNRTLPLPAADALSRSWMRPLRANRIAELLAARPAFDEHDFLAMQLDTRAEGYEQIRSVLLAALPADEQDPELAVARAALEGWNGHADEDQTGFRLLQAFYRALLERVLTPLLGAAIAADPGFVYRWPLADEPLRRVLEEQPLNLLPSEYRSWSDFLRVIMRDALVAIEADGRAPAIGANWGAANALDVAHPFAAQAVLAPFARWLKWPRVPLPGSMISLRVAAPAYGAVIRMAVAPADPASGILELAGGQSGHFLSPQFRDQLADWIEGAPSPFLAGPTRSTISLEPR